MTQPGTDLAVTSGALAVRPDQTQFSDDQLAVLRHIGTEKATPADLRVFLHRCQMLGLDPFAGQIHLVEYGGKPVIQVGIHGLESYADRQAQAHGIALEWEDVTWCGQDGVWTDVWLDPEPPSAARAVLLRDGRRFPAVALFREHVGMKKVYSGNQWTGGWEVNKMWSDKPAHMLGKVARAGALRTAFPTQLSGVYIPEEMSDRPDTVAGKVVRDEPPEPPPLKAWLDRITAATSRADLRDVWTDANNTPMSVTDRAVIKAACETAAAGLPDDPPPVADADGVIVDA